MFRGVRARLTATIVALVALTALVLGVAAYAFVDARLHQQQLDDAANQARFDLSVLIPPRLDNPPTPEQIAGLAKAFQARALDTIITPDGGDPTYEPATLRGVLETIPADIRADVDRGQIAFSWQTVAGEPRLIVGGRSAGTGPQIWFLHDVSAIVAGLEQPDDRVDLKSLV
jgi:hypothetical protein